MSQNFIYKGKFVNYKDSGRNGDNNYHIGYVSNEDNYAIFITEDKDRTDIIKTIRKKDIGSYIDIQIFNEKPVNKRKTVENKLKETWDNAGTLGKIGMGTAAVAAGLIGLIMYKGSRS